MAWTEGAKVGKLRDWLGGQAEPVGKGGTGGQRQWGGGDRRAEGKVRLTVWNATSSPGAEPHVLVVNLLLLSPKDTWNKFLNVPLCASSLSRDGGSYEERSQGNCTVSRVRLGH